MTYTVKSGDTLWDISRRYGVSISSIVNANPIIKDPDLIYGGWKLTIPGKGDSSSTGSASKTSATQKQLNTLEKKTPSYKASAEQTSLRRQMQALEKNQPKAYTSQYASKINEYLNRIENREKFSYDFNADPLYQQYKDQYTRLGQQAMIDTMGSAAALTGGYGSSYATTAGSQAYQGYLGQLNSVIPELYDRAYSRYQEEGNAMYQLLNTYQSLDDTNYGRYRDTVNDYYTKLDHYTNRYLDERNFDYTQSRDQVSDWQNNRDYYYQKLQNELDYALRKDELEWKKSKE